MIIAVDQAALAERLAAIAREAARRQPARPEKQRVLVGPPVCEACGQPVPAESHAMGLASPAPGHGEAPPRPAAVVFLPPAEPMAKRAGR